MEIKIYLYFFFRAPGFSRILRGGQTSFSRILRSDPDMDKRSSFTRLVWLSFFSGFSSSPWVL